MKDEEMAEKYAELENKIADIKANCDLAIEGRDVKIMELEKENENLKETLDLRRMMLDDGDVIIRQMQEQIERLQKENANLEKKVNENDICIEDLELSNIDLQKQLEQAKKIIRTFLNMPMPNNEEVFADVGMFLTKAEQFLKEIGK